MLKMRRVGLLLFVFAGRSWSLKFGKLASQQKLRDCSNAAAYWGEEGPHEQCPCIDEPQFARLAESTDMRQEHMAKTQSGRWKMAWTWNGMLTTKAVELKQCASCDEQENSPMTKEKVKWEKIFYLNLPRSELRRGHIEAQLSQKAYRIPYERFVGTDPNQAQKVNLTQFSDKGLAQYVKDMSEREKWGTVGTYVSHLRLLKHIHDIDPEGVGLYVIMEDDITLDEGWKRHLEKVLWSGGVPEDWDILKFGYWGGTRCQDRIGGVYMARNPTQAESGAQLYNGNLGYIVRPKSIPAILEQVRGIEVFDVDGVLTSLGNEFTTNAEDGRKKYGTWGARVYYTAKSLVRGGTGGQGMATERLGGHNANYRQVIDENTFADRL